MLNRNIDSNSWKSISKTSRQSSSCLVTPDSTEISRVISDKILVMRYLLYDRQPLCLFNGILYGMFPIENPSLGYKLEYGDYDYDIILLNPKFITEAQAIQILFGVVGQQQCSIFIR